MREKKERPKSKDDLEMAFASERAAKVQGRRWVDSKARQGQSMALIKHLFSHHLCRRDSPSRKPCLCGYSVQEVVDMMDWSSPTANSFTYKTAYREYPRLVRRVPHLDHSAYCRMIAGFKDVPGVLTFFASTGTTMDFEELESILNRRFGGSLWHDPSIRSWFRHTPKSSRSGMYNRWKKCEFVRPIVDALAVAETMLE